MIIDSHEHVMFPTELQLQKLKEAGVDKAILFCTTPHPERADSLDTLKTEMSILYSHFTGTQSKEDIKDRTANNINELTTVIQNYPDLFYGFGSVPLGMSISETKDWIATYILSNGLKRIGEFTPGSEEQIEQMRVIFETLDAYPGLPVWIHTFDPVTREGIHILMELTKKHPQTPVIFGHMGGYHWMEVIEFAKTVPNAYLDLSAAFSTLAARLAITELPDKCLYSSDAPYGEPKLSRELIEYISPSQDITDKVLGGNILKLITQ